MTQSITTAYHALDSSYASNLKAKGIHQAGVYTGYRVKPNGSSDNSLDIIPGNDTSSVLLTAEGVRVEETTSLLGAVTVAAADVALTRIDLVVAEYLYQVSGSVVQTYKIIKGVNQVDTSLDPIAPVVATEYQIPLALVTVRPKSSFTGVVVARIEVEDVKHIAMSGWIDPNTKPVIAPGAATQVYVYPGTFLSVDQRSPITFTGGYMAAEDPDGYIDNEVRYLQVGVTDEGLVSAVGSAATQASLPDLTRDVFPVAIVKVRKSFSTVNVEELVDIRFPYARKHSKLDEEDDYKDLLANSVFKQMRVERLVDDSSVELDTVQLEVSGASTDLSAVMDSTDTSLAISWAGASTVPPEAVLLATSDMLAGGNTTTVNHFMLTADAPVEGLRFQYSTSGSTSGFTATSYKLNEIIRIPAGGSTQLFIRLMFPRAAFSGTKIAKLYSFAILLNLDDAVLNTSSIGELGITALKNSVNNLIANGNFYYWSRLDVEGNDPDLNTVGDTQFSLSLALDELNAADGWQATSIDEGPADNIITRTHLTDLGASAATALKYVSRESGSATYLEYRVPVGADHRGRGLTFASDYRTTDSGAIGIGIALYARSTTGLVLKSTYEVQATDNQGTLLLNTDTIVGSDVSEIGFYYIFNPGAAVETLVWDARAVAGVFGSVPFTPVPNAAAALQQFYERGRSALSTSAVEGDVVQLGSQFGSPKVQTGTLVARVFQDAAADRSVNVSNISLDAKPFGVLVSSSATGSGTAVLDIDWEAFVKFDSSPAS